jgi:hypothetical protein
VDKTAFAEFQKALLEKKHGSDYYTNKEYIIYEVKTFSTIIDDFLKNKIEKHLRESEIITSKTY